VSEAQTTLDAEAAMWDRGGQAAFRPDRRARRWRLVGVAAGLVLASCGVLSKSGPPPKLHDFGTAAAPEVPGAAAVAGALRVRVEAPPWLEEQDIHYRLMYDDPTQLRAYAMNRWVACPAQLLEQRLLAAVARSRAADAGAAAQNAGAAVGPAAGAGAGAEVRLVLERFEQRFESPERARAVVRVRAERRMRGAPDAVRVFELARPSAPTVHGAVRGLSQATDATVRAVLEWAAAPP
jgi:cholesterol transport system auxiliary component